MRYSGGPVARKKVSATIDQYLCGKQKEASDLLLSPNNGIQNVVASLHGVPASERWPAKPAAVQMDQRKCEFIPRVVIVPVGGVVEFLNSDRLMHNIRSGGKKNTPFNRAQPHARTIAIGFKHPEIMRVDCDLHSWMHGWVVVAEHPFYAATNDKGEFVLENVPPGKYTLQLWHETLGTVTQEVTVSGDSTNVTVHM